MERNKNSLVSIIQKMLDFDTKIADIIVNLDRRVKELEDKESTETQLGNNTDIEALKADLAKVKAAVSYENAEEFPPLVKSKEK
jgi:hypothetical protein